MCFGGEQPPMLPRGLNRPELSLAYIGGRTHAVVHVLQRIRAVLESAWVEGVEGHRAPMCL